MLPCNYSSGGGGGGVRRVHYNFTAIVWQYLTCCEEGEQQKEEEVRIEDWE